MMNNIIYIIDKNLNLEKDVKRVSLDEYKKNIIDIIKNNDTNKNTFTIIINSDKDKNILNEYIKDLKVNIEYLSLDTNHVSSFLNDNENKLNTLIRIIVQIIKLNKSEGIDTSLIFHKISNEYKSLLSLLNKIFSIKVFYRNNEDNETKEMLYENIEYTHFKKHYELLKKAYKEGYIIEELMDKSLLNEMKFIIEDNNGMYRLTPLGESIFEKIYHIDSGIYNENKKIKISMYMENILESLNVKKYINKVVIKDITKHISKNYFEIKQDYFDKYILGNICDGSNSYILEIKINEEYDVIDSCIDLESRYCRAEDNKKSGLVEFILVRHADDLGESEKRIAGCYDFDITPKGQLQIKLLADRLKSENLKVDYVFTSPLIRAKKTADEIANAIDAKVVCYNSLEASNYGYSSGMTKREALIKYPNPREGYIPSSNIWEKESEIEYSSRIVKAFYNIYHSNIGKKVMIVTHGRAISAIMREVMQLPASKEVWIKCDDTSIHQFVMSDNFVEIIRINDAMHLKNK